MWRLECSRSPIIDSKAELLNFAKSLALGRPVTVSLGMIYDRGCAEASPKRLSSDEHEALLLIKGYLANAELMKISFLFRPLIFRRGC